MRDQAHTNMGRKTRSLDQDDRHAEMERLLVEGELVTDDDGRQVRVFPTGQEVAKRLGVSAPWVSKFARQRRCYERRAMYQAKVQEKAQEKRIEIEGKRLAFDTERAILLCDDALAKINELMRERGISNFSVADINTLVRLRRYLEGGADSRQEVSTAITLDSLQASHRDMMRRLNTATPEECGLDTEGPPTRSFDEGGAESKINPGINQNEEDSNVRQHSNPDIDSTPTLPN